MPSIGDEAAPPPRGDAPTHGVVGSDGGASNDGTVGHGADAPQTTTSNSVALRGAAPSLRWQRVDRVLSLAQSVSGICLSSFVTLHLTNALAAPLGQGIFDELLSLFRKVYRNRWYEYGVLCGGAMVHIFAGVSRACIRRANEGKEDEKVDELSLVVNYNGETVAGKTRTNVDVSLTFGSTVFWQRLTGYTVLFAGAGHVLVLRLLPAELSDFTDVHYFFARYPTIGIAAYAVFTTAAIYHTFRGVRLAVSRLRAYSLCSSSGSDSCASIGHNNGDDVRQQPEEEQEQEQEGERHLIAGSLQPPKGKPRKRRQGLPLVYYGIQAAMLLTLPVFGGRYYHVTYSPMHRRHLRAMYDGLLGWW
eukprot:TRINITY_DN5751_c2_g2_i1.p1 TRINITY_DN5751_c2_g2~~TRINITY_DN5751_c2_g2_i1.p1  ORF type:complete len:361 (+),score=69.36 TRINITY_DN5751_c2_g2_i1:124-1206(+)